MKEVERKECGERGEENKRTIIESSAVAMKGRLQRTSGKISSTQDEMKQVSG